MHHLTEYDLLEIIFQLKMAAADAACEASKEEEMSAWIATQIGTDPKLGEMHRRRERELRKLVERVRKEWQAQHL